MKRITKFTAILMAVLLLGTCNLQYSVPAADISQAEISQAEIPQAEIPQAESPDFVTEDTEEDAVEEDSGTEESGVSIPGAGEESSDEGDFGREGTEEDDLLNEGTETRQEEESVSSDLEDPAGEQGSISPDREDSAGEQGSISSDREDSAVEEESVGSDLEDPAGGEESRDDENESGTVVKEEEVNDNGAIEEEQSGNELVSENACSAAGSLPVIALDYVPASGVVSPLQGQVYMEDGSDFNPSAYRIAHEMGLSVVGTAYLCGKTSDDRAEMDALIGLCKKGYVQVACVGNETLLENQFIKPKLTAEQLIGDINYVRKGISGAGGGIPVTTSDSVDVLLSNASVRNACSLIMPNCYPFWGGADRIYSLLWK